METNLSNRRTRSDALHVRWSTVLVPMPGLLLQNRNRLFNRVPAEMPYLFASLI
jgi:hypothetical protein